MGHHEAERAGQVDLLLLVCDPGRIQPLRGGLDGGPAGVGCTGQRVDRCQLPEAGHRQRSTHLARGPGPNDAVQDGILDTTQKKRLFTILSTFPGIHVDKRPQQYGDRKKVYVAWIDDQKLAETEKDPDEKLKQFVKERKPTREQLLQYLGPFPEIAKKKFNKLIDEKKIRLADKYFIWIGKED